MWEVLTALNEHCHVYYVYLQREKTVLLKFYAGKEGHTSLAFVQSDQNLHCLLTESMDTIEYIDE